jgi:hypothetical protein
VPATAPTAEPENSAARRANLLTTPISGKIIQQAIQLPMQNGFAFRGHPLARAIPTCFPRRLSALEKNSAVKATASWRDSPRISPPWIVEGKKSWRWLDQPV